MSLTVICALAVFFGYRVFLVCRGRKPLTVKFLSFRKPQSLFEHIEGMTSHYLNKWNFRIQKTPEGVFIGTRKRGRGVQTFNLHPVPVDHPFALYNQVDIVSTTDTTGVRSFWQLLQIDPAPFGSIITLTVMGKFSVFEFLESLMRQLQFVVAACMSWKVPVRVKTKTNHVDHMKRTAFDPFAPKRARQNTASNFVTSNSNEIILSLIACASFWALYGFDYMLMLVPIILLHEYGHLVAYRMTGQTGNRMMLVPFMGGIAIASSEHKSEFDRAFCAIMGPAICVPLSIILTLMAGLTMDHWSGWWFYTGTMISASMNALNLLPMLPLDGGHSLESMARSIAPDQTSIAMLVMTVGGAIFLINSPYEDFAKMILIWGVITVAQTWGARTNARPLNKRQGVIITCFHAGTLAVHALCAWLLYSGILFDWFYYNFY
jgi:Zn-dependent protease